VAHFGIIILSHKKRVFVKQAIQSLLDQTHEDWEAWLVDSGALYREGFFDYVKDPRIHILETGETPEMQRTFNMSAWCVNKMLNSDQLSGELIMFLCDDDLFYPQAFETFWNFYISRDREPQAMYASQHIGVVDNQGRNRIVGTRVANRPAGSFCGGRKLDCRIDYLQFCHTLRLLERYREVYNTTDYLPVDKECENHADGVFMERVGAITKVYHINKLVSMNRRVPTSMNGYCEGRLGWYMSVLRAKVKGAGKRLLAHP
jgi:spore maturation protein CgeD